VGFIAISPAFQHIMENGISQVKVFWIKIDIMIFIKKIPRTISIKKLYLGFNSKDLEK
jgi:hypothetical protein